MRQIMHKLMAKLDLGCASIAHTSSVSLDRPLSLRERVKLTMHLLMCEFCRRYHRQLIVIQKLSSGITHDDKGDQFMTPRLSEEARERIRRAIDPSAEPDLLLPPRETP